MKDKANIVPTPIFIYPLLSGNWEAQNFTIMNYNAPDPESYCLFRKEPNELLNDLINDSGCRYNGQEYALLMYHSPIRLLYFDRDLELANCMTLDSETNKAEVRPFIMKHQLHVEDEKKNSTLRVTLPILPFKIIQCQTSKNGKIVSQTGTLCDDIIKKAKEFLK